MHRNICGPDPSRDAVNSMDHFTPTLMVPFNGPFPNDDN